MKPITHPLAIEIVGRMSRQEDVAELFPAWRALKSPLYTDPTPLPAPALGMRVWCESNAGGVQKTWSHDIDRILFGDTWDAFVSDTALIVLIADYRTNEPPLWRRQ